MATIGTKDNTKPNAINPRFPVPRNQTNYLGKVHERFEDNIDDTAEKPRNYKIKFDILGLDPFTDEWPIATLLGTSSRPVNVGDLVKIWDVCDLVSGMHTFFYEPVNEDRFTGVENYNNVIDLTEKNVQHIKLANLEITLDRHSGASPDFDKEKKNQRDQDDLDDSKGVVHVKLPGVDITYSNDDKKVTTKVEFEDDLTVEKVCNQTYKDDVNISSDKIIKIKSGTAMNLESGAPLNIKATGMVTINGVPSSIGFCMLPNCLFTGAPHTTTSMPTV